MKIKFSILTTTIIVSVLCVLLVLLLFVSMLFSKKNVPNKTETDMLSKIEEKQSTDIDNLKITKVKAITKDDHIKGNINAKVQMIIYSDFECPACLQYLDSIKKVEESYKDQVVIAYRHYPLRMHDYALPAAKASECAAEQGKFWEMHDKLFADNKAQIMNNEQFKNDAKDLGLDQAQFNSCLEQEKYKNKVIEEMAQAKLYNVTGTPATFINGRSFPGAYPFEDFTDSQGEKRQGLKTIIDSELGK